MARKLVSNQDNTSTSSQTEPLTRAVARPIFGENVLAIDYNFAEKGILDDDITFSRASGATQTNSEGKICYAPENGIKKSSQLNNWGKLGTDNTTITAATDITDPLGGNGAFRVTTNQANAGGIYLDLNDQVTKNNNTTVQSIYIRSVSGNKTTHVITHHSSSKGLVTITEKWQRIVIPYDSTLTAATNFYGVDFRDSATDATDVYLFAPQVSSSLTGEAVEYVQTTTAFVYKERFDYDKDGNSKGLLIEEARTNLDANSFAVGSLNLSTSFAASNEIDPSGGTSSYKITPSTGSGFHYQHRTYTVTDATVYTYSVYVKPDGIYKNLMMNAPSGNAAGNAGPIFNLETGQQESFLTADHPTTVTECGNGWYRISVQYTTSGTSLRIDHNILPTSASSSYSGDGSSGMLFWGSQLEAGSFPTSLIPTYGATADRAADIASVSGTNFSSHYLLYLIVQQVTMFVCI